MSAHLTWEQKFAALSALGECSLMMRKPGNWYVHDHIEVAYRGMLTSPTEQAATPEKAVEEHWRQLVEDVPVDSHLRIQGSGRRVEWNGFMWVDVPSRAPEANESDHDSPHAFAHVPVPSDRGGR